jgi:hypothetical protein
VPDAPTIVTSPRGLRARGWLPSLSFPDRAAAGRLLAFAKRHWVFLLLAAVGIALRVVTAMAYSPSLPLRNKDAYQYIARAETFSPVGSFHPFLYSATLKPFLAADAFQWLTIVQHAAGIAMAVLLYALLCRLGLPPWLGALGAAPVLLDGYQIAIEHRVFSETFFELCGVAGLVLLAWNAAGRWPTLVPAGILVGSSVLYRFAGLAIVATALLYTIIRRVGWVRLLIFVASLAAPLCLYAAWFHAETGTFALTNRNGFYLYGRVAMFADCGGTDVPTEERVFCPENLEHEPGRGLFASGLPDEIRRDPKYNSLAGSFARRMIRAHPAEYASAVSADFAKYFRSRDAQDNEKWLFTKELTERDQRNIPPGVSIQFTMDRSTASFLRSWQNVVSVYGPLLALLLALGLLGGIAGWATRARPPVGPEAALFALSSIGVMLFATVFAVYHFRYTIPAVPFAGAAGAAGAWALWQRFRRPSAEVSHAESTPAEPTD